MGIVEVHKSGLTVSLSSTQYISSAFETDYEATALLKPIGQGIQILKAGLYIVIARFAIATTAANSVINFGIRYFKSASDYLDAIDNTSSVSARTDRCYCIRAGHFDTGVLLRPIASVAGGGICSACTLAVISLKAD